MYNIQFDLPNLAKGAEINIGGLGSFINGQSFNVTDEEAEQFRVFGTTYTSETDESGFLTLTAVKGKNLREAFDGVPGITVSEGATSTTVNSNVPELLPQGDSGWKLDTSQPVKLALDTPTGESN